MTVKLRSAIILFIILLLALGVGGSFAQICGPAYASASALEEEEIKKEIPKTLNDLQNAGEEQLEYWADNLESFDGREFGIVTPAKFQGTKNICWAYAAIGAVETNILRKGIDSTATKNNLDFDEMVLAYARFNRDGKHDPLLLTTNDAYDTGMWNTGDSAHNAFAAMTEGYALVNEKNFPTSVGRDTLNGALEESKYFVQNYQNTSKEISAIKQAVLKYGAVAFSYVAPSGFINKYYSGSFNANHASIIVGWDDSIGKNDFSPKKPSSDGAWIVKNSWATHGYEKYGAYCYYISYEEPIIKPFVVDMALRKDYQNIYHYDGQIFTGQRNYVADAQAAIYEAKLSSATKQEQLKAVMIETSQSDLTANVKIYRHLSVNPGDVNDPQNIPNPGKPVSEVSKHLDGLGMHTIELPSAIDLEQGEYFSVVVSCTSQFGTTVPVACSSDNHASTNDMTYYLYNGVWQSYKKSEFYADTSNDNMSARIRAITNTVARTKKLEDDLKYARIEIPNRLVFYERGKELIPDLQLFFDGELLAAERDYTVEIKDNTLPGKATLTVFGKGKYKGTRVTYFEIAKAKYPPGRISDTLEVDGSIARLHQITLPEGWKWINEDMELKVGRSDYKFSIKYEGADKEFYQILTCDFYVNKTGENPPAKGDISLGSVEISGEYVYTGKQIEPNVKVTYQGLTLRAGVDYTLSFENCTNAGTGKVIVVGAGKYTGQMSKTFQIKKAQWPKERPSGTLKVGSYITNLSQISLKIKNWEWQTKDLEITKDSFVANAIYIGQDKNNYLNTQMQITILRGSKEVDIAFITELKLDGESFVFDGNEKRPKVVAIDQNKSLQQGVDFEVEYKDNVFAGQAKAIVIGKNSYTGSKKLTFTIEKAERESFSVSQQGWTYGEQNAFGPSVCGEMESADITYSYSKEENGTFTLDVPTDAGTYWVRAEIAPSQNYNAATAKAQFEIAQAESPSQMPKEVMTVARKVKTLQSVELISGWSWEDAERLIDAESIEAYAVYFDTTNYKTHRVLITITKEAKREAGELEISLEESIFVYDATLKTPKVVVKDGQEVLAAGKDFDVEYQNNKFAGEGKAIVTFKNDYTGTREFAFTISQAEQPSVDTTIHCEEGDKTLSDVPLPAGFIWDDGSVEISGDRLSAKAVYRGEDASSYKTCEISFEIILEKEQTRPLERESFPYLAIILPVAALAAAGAGFAIFMCRRKRR